MSDESQTKPSLNEWIRWGSVLARRLSSAAEVYRDHKLNGKATDLQILVVKLRQTLGSSVPPPHLPLPLQSIFHTEAALTRQSNMRVLSLTRLIDEISDLLPELSNDMQALLQSDWQGETRGRIASDFFKGEANTHNEGVGSGYAKDGQLPWVLDMLLARENNGTDRPAHITPNAPENGVTRTPKVWSGLGSVPPYMRGTQGRTE